MHAFIQRLQQMVYREQSLLVEKAATAAEVTRQTIWAWLNEKWPPSLYGAQKLVAYTQDVTLGRAFATGTGLRYVPAVYIEQPEPLFFLIANHAAAYGELIKLSMEIKTRPLVAAEKQRGLSIIQQFHAFGEQIAVQLL